MRAYTSKIDNSAPAATGILAAAEDNVRFEELTKAVSTAGITLDPEGGPNSDQKMLAQAMSRYASGGIYADDSGSANAYVLTSPSGVNGFVMPKARFSGMRVYWVPANTNTGASTANVWGLGVKAIRDWQGTALASGAIVQGRAVEMFWDDSADHFKMAPWCSFLVSPTASPSHLIAAVNSRSGYTNNAFVAATAMSASVSQLASGSTFNGERLTVGAKDAGLWLVGATVVMTTEELVVSLYKGGSRFLLGNGDGYVGDTEYGRYVQLYGMVPLTAGQYFDIRVYQRNTLGNSKTMDTCEIFCFKAMGFG